MFVLESVLLLTCLCYDWHDPFRGHHSTHCVDIPVGTKTN